MDNSFLQENEIICQTYAVKYSHVDYEDGYVVITQNRTRRRVPSGYYFDDDGIYIYVSLFYANIFQHKKKVKRFILNKGTKEWREYTSVIVVNHVPESIVPDKSGNEIAELKR